MATINVQKYLQLIAEGYYSHCEGDRYIAIHNPEYLRNDLHAQSCDKYIIYDSHSNQVVNG